MIGGPRPFNVLNKGVLAERHCSNRLARPFGDTRARRVIKRCLLDKNVPTYDFIFKQKIKDAGKSGNIHTDTNNGQAKLFIAEQKKLFALRIAAPVPICSFFCDACFSRIFHTCCFTADFIPTENTLLSITTLKCSTSRSLDIVSLDILFACGIGWAWAASSFVYFPHKPLGNENFTSYANKCVTAAI